MKSVLQPTEQQFHSTLEATYHNKSPLRTLWGLFEGRRRMLLLTVFFFIIKQTPIWVWPIVTGNLIDKITGIYSAHQAGVAIPDPQAVNWIIFYVIIMFVVLVQNIPTHTIFAWYLSTMVRQVQLILRSALVVRLQQLSMSFHDNTQSGKLQSKVLRDVEAVEGLCRMLLENLLSASIIMTTALVVTLTTHPMVTLFFLVTVPAAVVLMRLFRAPMRKRNEAFRREIEEMSGRVAEMIEMIPITRAHAVEDTEVERVHRQLLKIRHAGQEVDFTNNLFGSAIWVVFQCFQLLCLCFNLWQCYHGRISVGDVVKFQGFFGMVVGAVQQLTNIMPQMASGIESIRSIGEVLESPDVEQNEGKLEIKQVAGRLQFERVKYQYPETPRSAVDNFTLDVAAGECIAVVGESGSGKSTLMNLIIGFRRPTAGRILLDGVDLSIINYRSFRRFIAVVPQQTVLFSGSVRDNITYGLHGINDARLAEVLQMASCTEFVGRLPKGLDTPIGSHGAKLSGGQRQRIAIARALLRDPRIIILDEATSALDVVSERLVQEAINRLITGRTVFIVAHRLSTIRQAHRIVVMSEGRIVEVGTHDELLSRADSAFSKLHALQV